jgi:hypothetical protein
MSDVDEYNLRYGILGRHPEEFYGAIGRVVCVCAVLEEQVTTLRHTLENAFQGKSTQEPVGQQIKAARRSAKGLTEQARAKVEGFLDDVEAAFAYRNKLVHSSFPAQPDGRVWGHRATRDKKVVEGAADTVETSLDELRAFIERLSALISSFNQIHSMARMLADPASV